MHRYLPALMQRAGWKTVSVPVNHRHRTAGVSKYNNLNRALVGISDLRGVAWLIRRGKVTAVEEAADPGFLSSRPRAGGRICSGMPSAVPSLRSG